MGADGIGGIPHNEGTPEDGVAKHPGDRRSVTGASTPLPVSTSRLRCIPRCGARWRAPPASTTTASRRHGSRVIADGDGYCTIQTH